MTCYFHIALLAVNQNVQSVAAIELCLFGMSHRPSYALVPPNAYAMSIFKSDNP